MPSGNYSKNYNHVNVLIHCFLSGNRYTIGMPYAQFEPFNNESILINQDYDMFDGSLFVEPGLGCRR